MTPVDKKHMNSGGYRHLFCEGVQQQKSWPKKPNDASSDTLVMSSFNLKKFAAGAVLKKLRVFWVLINECLGGKRFQKVVCFTAERVSPTLFETLTRDVLFVHNEI